MKRKNFDTLSYIGHIDIRFEPMKRIKPIQIITGHAAVPAAYQQYLIDGALIHFIQYSFGIIFSQKVIIQQQAFWYHVFDLNNTVTFKPVTNALLICINYLTKGCLDCIVNGERLVITENTYQLYALAGSISYEATLEKGITLDFHTTVPEHMIAEMRAVYENDPLNKLEELAARGIFSQHLFRIGSAAKKHIQRIISYKHARSSHAKLARLAEWEQHLAALFAIYVADKNNYTLRQEWESNERMKVRNLPKYIEQYLYENNTSASSPLQLNNIIRKLKLREPEFKRAIHHEFHTTWKGLINKVRMEKAVGLLKYPQLTIADIAAQLGYSYHTHFTRAFKNYYSHTPAYYRDNII